MSALHPRSLVHRGVVPAVGFLIDTALLGEAVARLRVLQYWSIGATVHRIADGLLVRLPISRFVDCATAPGTPLIHAGPTQPRLLSSTPLSEKECRELPPYSEGVILMRGGIASLESLATVEDPATWIDLQALSLETVAPLAAPPAPPQLELTEAIPTGREIFGPEVGEAAPELSRVLSEMQSDAASRQAGRSLQRAYQGGSTLQRVIVGAVGVFGKIVQALSRLFLPGKQTDLSPSAAPAPQIGKKESWLRALGRRLRWLTLHGLHATRMWSLLQRRHADYFLRMIEMFEQGDLAQALRHAVPLAGKDAPEILEPPALLPPSPREELRISPQWPRAASNALGPLLYSTLQQLYRDAFHRLELQGQIEQAAFVLAELLHQDEEAVQFLEKNGQLRRAAELAESRELAPGLVVRQWFLAGDVERALDVAQRHGVFADAVMRLERTHRDGAAMLRMHWADRLATQGFYAAAVDAVWHVKGAQRLALAWIDKALLVQGLPTAMLLLRKLQLDASSCAEVYERMQTLLADDAEEARPLQLALLPHLVSVPHSFEFQPLFRMALRWQLKDAARHGHTRDDRKLRDRVISQLDDTALRADLPPLPVRTPNVAIRSTTLSYDAADAGGLPVLDAVRLPDGRILVALGEMGARLLTRDGRRLADFDQPAHRLVRSDHGDRALLLAPRDEVWRIARLDLLERRAKFFCETRIDRFCDSFDGAKWFVSDGNSVLAVDAVAPRLRAVWRVSDLPGKVGRFVRDQNEMNFVTAPPDSECWNYECPSLTLRQRIPISQPLHEDAVTDGLVVILCQPEGDDVVVHIQHHDGTKMTGSIRLGGTRRAAVRLHREYVVIADDRGRVLVLSRKSWHVLRELRLSV